MRVLTAGISFRGLGLQIRQQALSPATIAISVVAVAAPLLFGVSQVAGSAYRNDFDIFQQLVNSPFDVALPIAAVLIGCLPTLSRVRFRHAANTRARMGAPRFVLVSAASSAIVPFIAFFIWPLIAIAIAYGIWPSIGNPGVEPSVYNMTAHEAVADSLTSVSYSSLLAYGPLVYGLLYSFWLGLGAATYAIIGVLALIVIENRIFALSVPAIIYVGETLAVSLLGIPRGALMFSLFPFGITQSAIAIAALPGLLLVVLTGIATIVVVKNVVRRGWLT